MAQTTKVLLLDDNEDARILQRAILESQGYEVVTAENGKEGLKILETFRPDLIISDILMPEMDGFEFGMKVKQDEALKTIPFVFYSAQYTDENDQSLVEKVGAERFIIKPIEMDVFLAAIDEVLQKYRRVEEEEHPPEAAEPPESESFDQEHYRAQARMLDKKLEELEEKNKKLQESEAQYRRLLEGLSSDYFIYRHDTDGIFTYLSPTITDMLGYTQEEFQTHYMTYLTDSQINRDVEYYTSLGLEGKQVPAYELEIYEKGGGVRSLQVSEQPLFDRDGTVIGIEGVAHDITAEKQAERLKKESAEHLHNALIATIRAISMTVEKRDPYTAGHQQRVAALAVAIGEAMALDTHRLEGLRLGALVHDIGKISIPAEILTKPGRISDVEYRLIQTHPVEGYEILQGIEFPWPLAQMIVQHHERLDGSGYPNALHEEEILLEAKILCVADVVEAMTSDRPYRPGLGYEAAVAEIRKHSGTLYDAQVVQCCADLLEQDRFRFE